MGVIGVTPSNDDNGEDAVEVFTTVENQTKYVVEVLRPRVLPIEVVRDVAFVEVSKPVGTLINVGAGPELPTNPYEGQVWILI